MDDTPPMKEVVVTRESLKANQTKLDSDPGPWTMEEPKDLLPIHSVTMDPINHPHYYNEHPSGVECLDIIRHMNFNLGNVIKYVWRADLKEDAIQDLEKALFYLKDEIERRKNEPHQ